MTRSLGWAAVAALLTLGAGPGPKDTVRSGIDLGQIDKAVRPQDDLFRHINGRWLAEAEIPADRPADGAFFSLRNRSEAALRTILETAAKSEAPAGSEQRKAGDLYTSFLDEERAEKLGLDPIRPGLARVDAIADKTGLLRTLGEFQREGVAGAFGAFVTTDAKKSDRYIVYLNQGGLGLPDESYYRDEKFAKVREAYVAHVAAMFGIAGRPGPEEAAKRVMALETRLARSHWDRVRSRDQTLTYNKKTGDELAKLTPGLDWSTWASAAQARGLDEVIVRQPDYFTALAGALEEVPLSDWKTWLTWNVLRDAAPLLNNAMADENFRFFGRTLTGAPEQRPRWKRAVSAVERELGEAAGKLYVAQHFPPRAKVRMRDLVKNLVEAYRQDIQALDWMGPETKAKALDKLAKFEPKIGYPDKWRDYSKLDIQHDDLVGNVRRAEAFEFDRQMAKLGKPVDRTEWTMTPQTVNAYYNAGKNEIVFPAAILQPPFFDMDADDAANYGGIGAVIGHEIGHGFDDQGSKFDGDGNMLDWWTAADRAEFEKRAKALIAQYSAFEPAQLPGRRVNGALTVGENIGDLGGLTIAYKAYRISQGDHEPPVLEGLTGSQRFFVGWAQVWRAKYRDAELSRRLATDSHSPAEFRCNGVVRNLREFYEAFGVKEGDKLWLPEEQRVRIW
jgi:putative endopeptidase